MRNLDPAGPSVSRETLEKLQIFAALVREWSAKINIVSQDDLSSLWDRHVIDSAQLVRLTENPASWVDLGAGGGFPGMIVAIILSPETGLAPVTLIESDKRKCAFLSTAARKLDINVRICPQRIETLQRVCCTTLSARALAPLDKLLNYAERFVSTDGVALFPKGRSWRKELEAAEEKWRFDLDVVESVTDRQAAILRVKNIKRIQ